MDLVGSYGDWLRDRCANERWGDGKVTLARARRFSNYGEH